jgi:uncharacterized membrane protein YbhN (UPF0104 family)
LPATVGAIAVLVAVCHPRVFYGLVDRLLKAMKRPAVAEGERLGVGRVAVAVAGFLPCWGFGGLSMWAAARCVWPVGLWECAWFAGAFALSVIIGMASFLPGGLGIREAVVVGALTIEMAPAVGHSKAVILATVAAALQRLFQIVAEVGLGVAGGAVTGLARGETAEG